jgi:hypothetical protein
VAKVPEASKESEKLFTDLVVAGRGKKKEFSMARTGRWAMKIFLGYLFLPMFILLNILENKNFVRLLRVAIFVAYTLFIVVGLYTLATRNQILGNSEKIVVELDYRDRIEELR